MQIFAVVLVNFRLLLSEQQVPRKDAVFGQAGYFISVSCLSRHQINSVPSLQAHVQVAAGYDEPVLPGGEGVQNPIVVTEKVQTGILGFHRGVEAELMNAWNLAGEVAVPSVVTVLPVVDDVSENDGLACTGEVVAQSDREGNILSSTRRSGRKPGHMWASGNCEEKKELF